MRQMVTNPDGHIYTQPGKKPLRPKGCDTPFINKAWLDRLGLEIPTTVDEWYEVLKAFKEQDANGNGMPDDTWYELKGSETGKSETLHDYAVTYYRPRGAGMETRWTDNRGGSGSIDYLKQFHDQGYYYPAWVEAESYTLRGTRLEARNYDQSGNGSYWVNAAYEWGYADNFSPIDRLTDDDNVSAAANPNHFRIADAVTFEGAPAGLEYIDFVKVQTGVKAESGWRGELSTEVVGFYDYRMRRE